MSHWNGNAGREIGKIVSVPLGHPPSSSGNRKGNGPPAVAVPAAEVGIRAKEEGITEQARVRPNRFDQATAEQSILWNKPAPYSFFTDADVS
jgi:hypothetical protein